ncbi:threonine/homoserine efflux transporter RhtA [Asanoa ferruginea]|uniref:Threonine/homoserine efflux transporter RhtA n=1 Tax=Asanoa ferruginea TaxID=53367 RepID=A0A3D9ZU79_9ACTN|nr:DMT family transporter [Asanoa ferruginea]REG00746.1 threonine/homoserine efflux transporter RhtA [Asanoa ferruginea]GIF47379.1 membrane protein [Asanoa ferruginea]
MPPTRSLGLLFALLSALTFSTSGPLAHALLDAGWSAPAAVAIRVGTAAAVLAVPAAIALRGRWAAVRRGLTGLVLFGVLGVGIAQVAFFNAIRYLPVGVALLLEYLGVVLVVFWMWAVHGQRPRALTAAGAVTAVVGLALVLDLSGGARLSLVGVLWGLLAGVGLAAYFVLGARDSDGEGVPPLALATAGLGIGAVLLVLLGAVGLLPMHAAFGTVSLGGQRVSWLVPVAGLSLVAAVVPYVAGIVAARALGARLSSFVGLTEVLFAVLIAWLVLDELPTPVQIAGGALIIAGVVLVRLDERKPAEVLVSA